MNYFTKSRIYVILILIMVILNIVLIGLFIKGPFWKLRGDKSRAENRVEFFLERKLDLSKKQIKAYRDLRITHFKNTKEHFNDVKTLKKSLFKLVGTENNQTEKQELLQQIAIKNKVIDSLTFHHFEALRELCGPSQKAKFDHIIEEVLVKMDRRGPFRNRRRRR